VKVEGGANRNDGHPQPFAVLIGPHLLAWAAQRHKRDPRAAGANAGGNGFGLDGRHLAELTRLAAGNQQLRKARLELGGQCGDGLGPRPVEIDGQAGGRGAFAHAQHQRRPVDAVAQTGAMEQVERPAHGLAVRHHQVQVIEPVAVLRIEHAGHDPVDGLGGNGEGARLRGGSEDGLHGGGVGGGVDEDAEEVDGIGVAHPNTCR